MRFTPSIFGKLLEPIGRRRFADIVERHAADAYDKTFHSWDHLVTLIYAQFSASTTLRGLIAGWNAHSHHHYHLGSGTLVRSTLSDANQRRPVAVFSEVFTDLAGQLDRGLRREGQEMLRLIDSTPVPLGKLCAWAKSNGRIRGMKVHVVFDPDADCPRILGITDANINDAQIGRQVTLEAGASYVFDKGYCHYGWWTAIAAAGAVFVTRPKTSMKLAHVAERPVAKPPVAKPPVAKPPVAKPQGDGFVVLHDSEVRLASKGDSKLPMRLRRLTVQRQQGDTLTLLTNDLERAAVDVAALYKRRWQIELLFRWIKQHLRIRKFLGNSDNAIRLQIFAAMIAYALLRIAARSYRVTMPIIRFTDLLAQCLFDRRRIEAIDKPPPVNPSKRQTPTHPNQLALSYA